MGSGTMRIGAAVALLLAAALPARADDGKCHIYRAASVDMGIDAVGRMTVPMTVGGQAVSMLVDTGGVTTMLTDAVVSSLGLLKEHVGSHVRITMYGGTAIDHYTKGKDIEFGALKAPRMDFLVMPDGRLPAGVDGLLAPDILRAYDDDFDFANAKFALFSPDHCPGRVVYWTTPDNFAQIDIRLDDIGHIELPVTIDGQEVRFTFDTGASSTVMSLELAEQLFHIDGKSPDLKPVAQRGNGEREFKYPFKTLTFGGGDTGAVTVNNPDITLVPDDVSHMSGHGANGKAKPEDVAAAAAKGDAASAVGRQCEADFYLGEWWLTRPDPSPARPLLQSAADRCPHDYVESGQARTELARQK